MYGGIYFHHTRLFVHFRRIFLEVKYWLKEDFILKKYHIETLLQNSIQISKNHVKIVEIHCKKSKINKRVVPNKSVYRGKMGLEK